MYNHKVIECGLLLIILLWHQPLVVFAGNTDQPNTPIFTDIRKTSGLDFVNFNGMSGEFYFVEMTGQGGGFVDFDNDGDLDVYLLQGRR